MKLTSKLWTCVGLIIVLLAMRNFSFDAYGYQLPSLQATNYFSPSQRIVWRVEPTEAQGRGEGIYRVRKKGKEYWAGKMPFTFYDAHATDDGLLAGYAYTQGLGGGWPKENGNGELRVAILQPNGKLLLDESVARTNSWSPDACPEPQVDGLIVDQASDRFIVRLFKGDTNIAELWWIYQLSTGKALGKLPLACPAPETHNVLAAMPVKNTPLVLVHYERSDRGEAGAYFALVDANLREVWHLSLPTDYVIIGDKEAQNRLMEKIKKSGGILSTATAHQFEIWNVAAGQRVTYRVTREAQGNRWKVSERGRKKFADQ